MLTVFDYKELVDTKLIRKNDEWFNFKFLVSGLTTDDRVKEVMKAIDGAEPKSDRLMDTPLDKGVLISYLSTGCKTALNIYNSPDTCFDACECGNNALLEILKLPKGKVLMPERPSSLTDFPIDINYVTHGGVFHCNSYNEFIRIWDMYY